MVATRSTEEMLKPTAAYVAEVIRWIDPPDPPKGASTETPPCGDSAKDNPRKSVFRAYNVTLESSKHQAAFERVRDGMIARGYKITSYDVGSDRSGPGGTSGRLRASDPQSGYGIMVSSTSPPTEITIWVGSPCFVPAPTAPAVSPS
ncbi:hypothetical protein [Embleya sp. NPDC050493]|uniref:hypothetical protein n=1 Tax=Embleya sp. NPDC050493 TaxID=3363989 RepID=UPI0037B3271B